MIGQSSRIVFKASHFIYNLGDVLRCGESGDSSF